jgi:hypothetical protein
MFVRHVQHDKVVLFHVLSGIKNKLIPC